MKLSLQKQCMYSLALALALAIVLWLGIENGIMDVIRIILGSVFLLFLPGYRLTQVFFQKKEIDRLERFALSFALSIAVVPLLVFYLNLAGVPITEWLVWGVVVVIIGGSFGYIKTKKNKKIKKSKK